ncbi:MAG TPA: SpoIIE family protein phosphatase [Pseudonocardiaceae bacterium]|nr:SpoIIE family protein phosphatase [Pseudonocardiaceae bacterium]
MTAQDVAREVATPGGSGDTPILLIEDDDGDALLVEEYLLDASAPVTMHRARSLGEAKPLLPAVTCVLLDLGLPDTTGLDGLRWLQRHTPQVAVVVLTGLTDEHRGEEAVAAGAQDYLVKGQVDGPLLARVIRYAVERRRSEEIQRQLHQARIYAEENARLERGLLPSPLVSDPWLSVATRYRSGGQRMLLGGDFFDVVQAADGWVHAVVGDVCGHGPDEAALGVCLRVAWRTMVLAGRPVAEILPTLRQVFEHERHPDALFATLCMLSVAPDRAHARLHLAGHPPPLLLDGETVRQLDAPVAAPLGVGDEVDWPSAEIELAERWTVLLYTDGLIEGRLGEGPERLGIGRLTDIIESFLRLTPASAAGEPRAERLLDLVIDRVRELNGGDLDDDLAVLALGAHPWTRAE